MSGYLASYRPIHPSIHLVSESYHATPYHAMQCKTELVHSSPSPDPQAPTLFQKMHNTLPPKRPMNRKPYVVKRQINEGFDSKVAGQPGKRKRGRFGSDQSIAMIPITPTSATHAPMISLFGFSVAIGEAGLLGDFSVAASSESLAIHTASCRWGLCLDISWGFGGKARRSEWKVGMNWAAVDFREERFGRAESRKELGADSGGGSGELLMLMVVGEFESGYGEVVEREERIEEL